MCDAEKVVELSAEVQRLRERMYDWASAMDLANTWARERGVEEASGLGEGLHLRNLIDRLWLKDCEFRRIQLSKDSR